MYCIDMTGAQTILTYSEVFQEKGPDLVNEIGQLNMHKAISIIHELICVRNKKRKIAEVAGQIIELPFETVLKKEMCNIVPKTPEEMISNPLLAKDKHIISAQMLLILLKKIIIYGDYDTLECTDYQISIEDYITIIKLQLAIAEEINDKQEIEMDTDHFLYSTYHFNYQRNVANEFMRMYYMMEIISRDKTNFKADVQNEYKDYYNDFTMKYRFTPTEYSAILFPQLAKYYSDLEGITYRTSWFDVESTYGISSLNEKEHDVLDVLSKPINEYKEWAKRTENAEWDFSEFLAFPFFRDTDNNFISLSDITLNNAFFENLFWLIRGCYPKTESRAMDFFGRLYEKYVQDITESASKNEYTYIDEFMFDDSGKKKRSSDAYVRKDEELLIVEAKGFSVLIDSMTKNESVEKNNKKLFVDPILQADVCLAAIMDSVDVFDGVKKAYIISVTMDNINAVPNYYNSIHRDIIENKHASQTECFFNLNIEEYEMLIGLMERGEDIFNILSEYYSNPCLKPFGAFMQDEYGDIGMTAFMKKYYADASNNMANLIGITLDA